MKSPQALNRIRLFAKLFFLLFLILGIPLRTPAPVFLKHAEILGEAADQAGNAAWIEVSSFSIGPARAWVAGTDTSVSSGLLLGYDLTNFSPLFPSTRIGATTNFQGITLANNMLFPVGAALPPKCGASDGVGGTESKSMLARYATN